MTNDRIRRTVDAVEAKIHHLNQEYSKNKELIWLLEEMLEVYRDQEQVVNKYYNKSGYYAY